MHPTDKAARVAGVVYSSMVTTAPFSLIYVPNKLICTGGCHRDCGQHSCSRDAFSSFDLCRPYWARHFHLPGNRSLSVVEQRKQELGVVVGRFRPRFCRSRVSNALNNIAALILFRGGDFLTVFDTAQLNALGMLFVRLHSQGIFIDELFWGYGSFRLGC